MDDVPSKNSLQQIRGRRKHITPPPWYNNSYLALFAAVEADHPLYVKNDEDDPPGAPGWADICHIANKPGAYGDMPQHSECRANRDFITNAPDDIDWLLGLVKRQREVIRKLVTDLEDWLSVCDRCGSSGTVKTKDGKVACPECTPTRTLIAAAKALEDE